MKTTFFSAWLAMVFALAGLSMQAAAEGGGAAAAGGSAAFSQAELDQMMAPVALYPDSLLSQILMAATYPDQVAEAAKWSKANSGQKGDEAVTAVQDKGWDPAVASLVAFPQVLEIMSEKPDWVRQMGDAFLADTEAVMATVQSLRKKAKEAGNLESSEQQTVVVEQEPSQTIIKIEPADPQVIYVPAYNPTVVYGTWWWPAYPPFYYYPPGYGIATAFWTGVAFGIGIGITNAIWGGCNWRRGDVNINVNRYNRININNRLDVNKGNVSWKNQNMKRRENARTRLGDRKAPANRLSGADKRKDFRGRDVQREQARQALKDKGIDPARERKALKGSGGERVRDQVGKVERDRGALRDKTSQGDRRSFAGRGDNALSGLGEGRRSNLSSERGGFSNRSFERNSAGGALRGGGGGLGGRGGGASLGGGGHFGGRR
jgi:hypothetical protein